MIGYLFSDPVQILGFCFIILTFIVQFLLGQKLYRDYLGNKSRTTLMFSLTFLFWGSALFFLALERLLISGIEDDPTVILFAYIAVIFSVVAILFMDLFASHLTFPKHVKKLMFIPIVLSIIFLTLLLIFTETHLYAPFYEIEFPHTVRTAMLFTIFPLYLFPIGVLAYYSYRMKSRSPPHAKRSAWVAVGLVFVILTYMFEVIGSHETINYLRGMYVIATIIFYICFTWFMELQWPQKIRHVYLLLAHKGFCLFDNCFKPGESKNLSPNLVSGFIAGISSLVQEITQTDKKLKVIDVEDIKIILEHGNRNVIGVLMTEENFKILRNKLKKLVEGFESQFAEALADFSGNISQFERTKEIVDGIFTYEEVF
ncbi:MAG: hypothetical protein HWN65_15560 [Candidatus Helarchaeota archaeon]|nr:hypothetical protein [Candidatus Helarchaeota archaeon]